ncbi:CBS domain protein [Stieleria neptunia]|uniref:CBS domain protein n=2 Tax=Stieleria neptunia TaxID=2527979 RepID=A0A518I346_9BACT|nr:CBS domain protein [Stieleria neptunia]
MNRKHPIPTAESIMNRHVRTLTPEMSLRDVVRTLRTQNISCAPVITLEGTKKKTLIGFLSEARDHAYVV